MMEIDEERKAGLVIVGLSGKLDAQPILGKRLRSLEKMTLCFCGR